MKSNTAKNRGRDISRWLIVGLVLVIIIGIIRRIFTSPFDFDEGAGLIVSRMIFATGRYTSYEALFDPIITVGPTVYFPAALTYIFGNVFLPRLVLLLYSLLLIFVVVTKIFKDNTAKIMFLCLLCLTPYYLYFSSHVLGEIPAIFFAVTGLYLLSNKKYFLSGLFLCLAIITKNIFLLSFAPALYLFFADRRDLTVKKFISFCAPFFLVNFFWELYRLYSFDFSIINYLDNLRQFVRYHKTITVSHPEYFFGRIQMLTGTFGLNGFVLLLSMISISVFSFLKKKSNILKALSLYTLIYIAYFFIIGSTVWYRHFFPAIIFFVITLADISGSIRLSKLSLIPIAITIFINLIFSSANPQYLYQQNLLPLFDQTGRTILTQSDILKQQLKAADYISSHVRFRKISGVVWYNAPEISYLSGEQIFRTPEDKDVSYLISHPFGHLLVPEVDAKITKYPGKDIVLDTPLYKIYLKNE